MSAKSAIQVCIKVRPCESGQTTLWQVKDKRAIQLIDSQADPCFFDYVFDQDSNNQIVFDCMAKHIVEACMKGFNGTIFAYGQTSSGKTYTMMGDERNPGVMVLAAKEIFKQIARHDDRDFLLRVGYIEIYNEKIYDLLNKKNQDLKIHESNGMVHVNCEECIITSEEDLLQFLCMGNKERTVGETNMNERSSRSHAIFRIIIESRKTDRNADDAVIQSLLNLVDLAGSERADQTGARGARLKEGGHINKSLHFLSNVIKSLAENEDNKYVSFRDSKLTRILQASLGGNTFTSIICSIKPSIMEESQSTLNFAMRAKKIRLKPQMNEIVSDATMMKRLEREIKELKDRLAEEQRRNESQIKVRLLEQRIKTDTLKIITSNTIADRRCKNRRRTWCPATSNPEATNGDEGAAADLNGDQPKYSGLPKPSFYPSSSNSRQRPFNAPKTINIMKSLEVAEDEEDEFKPATDFDFGQAPNPMITSRILPPLSLTPRVADVAGLGNEMIVRDLTELNTFIKLERNIDSEWQGLNEKFAAATAQVDELQSEKQSLMQRCEDFDTLTKSKEAADSKIVDYEEQLRTLKQTVQRLEMENRAAVDLEFQFESHKTKAKLRESELLSALSEKDGAIDDLQHRLLELSRDVLCNSKEDLMRSICPDIETSCERICNKCKTLELLLEEHKQSTSSSNGNSAHTIDCECEQLRMEIANTRTKLESVQQAYKQMTSDVAEKSELCDRLNRDYVAAEEAKGALQQKCDNLIEAQQHYEQTIQSMQGMYEDIQKKYVQLQQDYERLEDMQQKYVQLQQDYELLEANREKFEKIQQDYENLESQNERLQQEISTLKASMEQLQERLIAGTVAEDREQQTIALVQEMRTRNEKLMADIVELETRFNAIQLEYDDMSNQLMESVQDGDNLREQCNALQQQLQQQEKTDKVQELLAHIAQLESEVAEKNMLIDATEGTINNLREQMTNLESALLEKSVIVNKVEDYQRQIESLEKQHAEMTMVCEELQEKVKENTINESDGSQLNLMFNQTEDPAAEVVLFKEHLSELKAEVNQLQTQLRQKDELIDRMQTELQELNERCMNMDVQQVELQANAREQQQLLERQAAKLSDDAERIDKLQESNAQLLERSIKAEERLEQAAEEGNEMKLALEKSQTDLELEKQQHKEQLESIRDEYEKRLNEMQIELEKSQKEFEVVEKELKTSSEEHEKRLEDMKATLEQAKKEHRDGLDNLKLDYLQKIEASEMNFRQNLRKYNIEWEEGKATYEASIERLAKQLTQRTEYTEKLCRESETKLLAIKAANDKAVEQLVKEKHELESMYDNSQKLLKQLQNQQQKDDSELQAMYEQQKRDYEQLKTECNLSLDTLKQEKSSLQFEVDECKLLIERLNNEQEQLNSKLELAQKEEANYLERVETLNAKIDDLVKDVKEADLKAKDFDQLLSEHKETKCLLAAANELSKNLTDGVNNLKRDLLLAQTEAATKNTKVEKLQAELEEALLLKSNACVESENLSEKLKELEANVVEKSNRFEQNIKELQSCKNELQLKLDSVESQKMELIVKLKNELNLQDLNAKLQQTNEELLSKIDSNEKSLQQLKQTNTQLENRLAEAEKNSSEEAKKLEKLQIEIDKLRSVMKTTKINFEAERKRMDGTISSLLEDKRNLEEKLCTAEEILKKLESDVRSKANGSNISFDSNASSNSSPAPRKSLDRDHNQPRKSLGVESELRKNRRMSTHDERRQSYWNDSRHVACMTDPVDNSCNCEVLDRKLKDSQRDLFIMESRVTALSIELKNHPLKEETATLKKRLQEEQAKARDEIKKLKQKNTELMSKMNVQAASAAISVSSQAMPEVQLATVQTQTECDAFKKMSDKLNDCLQLCRHRYTKIKELEDRLKQNENADTSNISSQTAGQINALKSQLEAQKKDNLILKNKYEFAKRALKLRKDELEEMRKVAGIDQTDQ